MGESAASWEREHIVADADTVWMKRNRGTVRHLATVLDCQVMKSRHERLGTALVTIKVPPRERMSVRMVQPASRLAICSPTRDAPTADERKPRGPASVTWLSTLLKTIAGYFLSVDDHPGLLIV